MLVGILEVVRTLDRDAQSAYRIGSGKRSGKRKESKEGLLFSIRPKEFREGRFICLSHSTFHDLSIET